MSLSPGRRDGALDGSDPTTMTTRTSLAAATVRVAEYQEAGVGPVQAGRLRGTAAGSPGVGWVVAVGMGFVRGSTHPGDLLLVELEPALKLILRMDGVTVMEGGISSATAREEGGAGEGGGWGVHFRLIRQRTRAR